MDENRDSQSYDEEMQIAILMVNENRLKTKRNAERAAEAERKYIEEVRRIKTKKVHDFLVMVLTALSIVFLLMLIAILA